MQDFLRLHLHLGLNVIVILGALLYFISLEFEVLKRSLSLLLSSAEGHVLLLDVFLSDLLVLFESLNDTVLLHFDLLDGNQFFSLDL